VQGLIINQSKFKTGVEHLRKTSLAGKSFPVPLRIVGIITCLLVMGSFASPIRAQVISASTINLTSEAFGDNVLQVYTSGQTPGVSTPVLYMNGGGGLYSSSYQILGNSAPTSDQFKLAIWSDVYAPALIIRPSSQTLSTDLATMDATGNYNFTVKPDGSLWFAGPGAGNTYSKVNWDTSLKRLAAGYIGTSGEFSASEVIDTPVMASFVNDTQSNIPAGTVVKIDPSQNQSFIPTVSALDPTVLGVVAHLTPPATTGLVVIHGVTTVDVIGTVSPGARLVTANGFGVARQAVSSDSVPIGAVLGKAISSASNGQVKIIIQ
jgi:hypothetical protein